MPDAPILTVNGLQAWYGESHILHGATFEVRAGEVVTLLGRNGAGKTTTLKAIMGMVARRSGSVRFEGKEMIGLPPHRIAALIKRVAADRTVLMVEHNLSVVENLCQRITVLTRGRVLAEGDYATVSNNPDVREAYMGTGHA